VQVVEATLRGHLKRADLERELARAGAEMHDVRCGLVMNCLEMTDYDLDARHAFVEWQRANRSRIVGVAILTTKTAWHIVISAMALASGQRMRPFETRDAAEAWLRTVAVRVA
jgi:hypothetical protein